MDKFEDMHIALYSQSDSIGIRPWTHFAVDAGIQDTLAFRDCLSSEASDNWVVRDTVAAFKLGVTGTPTFLINDLLVRGFYGDAVMNELISAALAGTQNE